MMLYQDTCMIITYCMYGMPTPLVGIARYVANPCHCWVNHIDCHFNLFTAGSSRPSTFAQVILRQTSPLLQASLHLTLTRVIPRLPRVTGHGLHQVEAFLLEASHLLTLITRGLQVALMEPPLALQGVNSMAIRGETSTIVDFPKTGREVGEVEEALEIKGEKTQGKDTELFLLINQNVLLL